MEQAQVFETAQLGEVVLDPKCMVDFPDGIPGFEQYKKYVIVTIDKYVPFQWLQSLEEPHLSFPIIKPILLYPEYAPFIAQEELCTIRLESFEEADVYFITTVGAEPQDVSVNMRAPLLLNREARLGKQCILADRSYSLKHPLVATE